MIFNLYKEEFVIVYLTSYVYRVVVYYMHNWRYGRQLVLENILNKMLNITRHNGLLQCIPVDQVLEKYLKVRLSGQLDISYVRTSFYLVRFLWIHS